MATVVGYTYATNSDLVGGINFQRGGATPMTLQQDYDNLARLRQAGYTDAQAGVLASFAYAYNAANQRVAVTNAGGSRWNFGYDGLGQVTNGWRYWPDGNRVLGQTFDYSFDDIGNRKQTGTGGDAAGGSVRMADYWVNLLNQYTNRTIPPYIEVNGTAAADTLVTVNDVQAARQGEYYRREAPVNNSAAAWTGWLTAVATNAYGTSTVSRLAFTPKDPETFTYDLDGNLTSDGLWNYTWDAENRLTRIEIRTNAVTDSSYWRRIECDYDAQSRRVRKRVFHWDNAGSAYHLQSSLKFFYDGWNLIGQVDELTGIRTTFMWGLDLSGSLQGAGGVGGLKAITVQNGDLAGTYFCAHDGNGNVALLLDADEGTEAARYEYGPFGELIRATGPACGTNPFRFSTKYQDEETDLLYYGYRYYQASTGRWLSRDPIEEDGGPNIYAFALNDPVSFIDDTGLQTTTSGTTKEGKYLQPRTSITIGPFSYEAPDNGYLLGAAWLLGQSQNKQYGPNDVMTQELQRSTVMSRRRTQLIQKFKEYCARDHEKSPYVVKPFEVVMGGELRSIGRIFYSAIVFPRELNSLPAGAFTGSFSDGSKMTVTLVDCCECTAHVKVHVVNLSGVESASRKAPSVEGYGPSLFSNNPFGPHGPMHNFSQTYDWEEVVYFGPCGPGA